MREIEEARAVEPGADDERGGKAGPDGCDVLPVPEGTRQKSKRGEDEREPEGSVYGECGSTVSDRPGDTADGAAEVALGMRAWMPVRDGDVQVHDHPDRDLRDHQQTNEKCPRPRSSPRHVQSQDGLRLTEAPQ